MLKPVKSVFYFSFALLLFMGVVVSRSAVAETNSNSVKIGVLLPLTGPLAEYGGRVKKGIDLAAEQINMSSKGPKVDLVVMDSQAQPRLGLSAYKQMLDLHGIHYVLGDVSSSVTLAIVPLLEQDNVLMLSPAASNYKLSGASPLFGRVWPTDALEATSVAKYALSSGCKKAATIVVNVDYGVGLGKKFGEYFSANGGEIIYSEFFTLNNTDFRIIWNKVSKVNPGCIYFAGHKPEILNAVAQYREAGLNYKILGNTNFEDAEILSTLGKALDGVVYGTATLDTSSSEPSIRDFVSTYKKKNNNETPTLYSANGYDLLTILRELQIKFGKDIPGAMKYLKSQAKIDGVGGPFRILESGDVERAIAIKTVKNGEYVTLGGK